MKLPVKNKIAIAVFAACAASANAAVVVIPNSALVPSTTLWTTDLGIGIGAIAVMTGGGNDPNVGGLSGRNDDGFMGPIALGFNFTLFGTTYTSYFANNNGNITFTSGLSSFTPTGLQGSTLPIISPYFGDVDTRNLASGVMHVTSHTEAGGKEIIVTWDKVGFYNSNGAPLNEFQLVVREDGFVIPAGEGRVGFFWNSMGWEVGEASGGNATGLCPGVGGLGTGCVPAAVGFGDGASNGFVLEGSTLNGIAGIVNNHRLWVNLTATGVPITTRVPEPATLALLGLGLAGLGLSRRKKA